MIFNKAYQLFKTESLTTPSYILNSPSPVCNATFNGRVLRTTTKNHFDKMVATDKMSKIRERMRRMNELLRQRTVDRNNEEKLLKKINKLRERHRIHMDWLLRKMTRLQKQRI
jgi:hypothetical protein